MADNDDDEPQHAAPEPDLSQGTPPPGNSDGQVPPPPPSDGRHRR